MNHRIIGAIGAAVFATSSIAVPARAAEPPGMHSAPAVEVEVIATVSYDFDAEEALVIDPATGEVLTDLSDEVFGGKPAQTHEVETSDGDVITVSGD